MSDLERARLAYAAVKARSKGADWKKYRAIALKLPAMVHREGLAPALHFVAARSEAGQRWILDDLAKDLGTVDRDRLLAWCRSPDRGETVADQTREVLRRLAWYKRIVQAFGKEGHDPNAQVSP